MDREQAIKELLQSEAWPVIKQELIGICAEYASVGNQNSWEDVLGSKKAIEIIGEWFSKLGLLTAEEIGSGIKSEHLRYFED